MRIATLCLWNDEVGGDDNDDDDSDDNDDDYDNDIYRVLFLTVPLNF